MAGFDYFGEEFTFASEFPYFAQAEFFEAMEDDDISPSRATAVALRLALACVDEADRARFRKVSRQKNAKTEDWLRVFREYTAEEAGRPTQQPTDSSAGQADIPQRSESQPVASVTSLATKDEVPARTILAARRSGLLSA